MSTEEADSKAHNARVWQSEPLATKYLNDVRGALPLAREQLDVMHRIIAALNPGVTRLLDLGCGSGTLGGSLLERFPRARCVFADFSLPMLGTAREALAEFEGRTEFVDVDYGDPQWPSEMDGAAPFDAVVSGQRLVQNRLLRIQQTQHTATGLSRGFQRQNCLHLHRFI